VTLASSAREFSFYEDSSGLLWMCYSGATELASLDPNARELTRYFFYDARSKKPLAASVLAALEDKKGTLWLGTQRQAY
jgi:hypothetical protein